MPLNDCLAISAYICLLMNYIMKEALFALAVSSCGVGIQI